MKFIINSQVLSKKLKSISGLAGTSKSLPILNNFLFELKKSELYITASDSETTIRINLEVQAAEEDGAICIPAKILTELLDKLPDLPVNFTVDEEQKLTISAGKGSYSLVGEKADYYPAVSFEGDITSMALSPTVIVEGIHRTVFATSDDEIRPAMCGVKFELSPEGISFVGTNAHILVKYTRTDAVAPQEMDFIIHKKSLNYVKNILGEYCNQENAQVNLDVSDKNVKFSLPGVMVLSRLIDGKLPNYKLIIPTDNTNKLYVNKNELKAVIMRAAIFSEKSTTLIRLKIQGQELFVKSEDRDFAHKSDDSITCNYEGVPMEIAFNGAFLTSMLNAVDSEEVYFELSDPRRSGLLFPVDKDDNEEMLMLIMPLQIL
jgi:DNA polymerase-3 subunit beta